jgi:hypothetical protein
MHIVVLRDFLDDLEFDYAFNKRIICKSLSSDGIVRIILNDCVMHRHYSRYTLVIEAQKRIEMYCVRY